jgi:phosphoribosyl 1,2-cyclic phosphodiesterase
MFGRIIGPLKEETEEAHQVRQIEGVYELVHSKDTKDKRLRPSIMVESGTTTIVVDTTPDFRYQMLREKVKNVDAILFTHPHKDHVAGPQDQNSAYAQ